MQSGKEKLDWMDMIMVENIPDNLFLVGRKDHRDYCSEVIDDSNVATLIAGIYKNLKSGDLRRPGIYPV
ncbi:hypothetical protein EYC80_001298 [Monilinia laxa]|uniref:Uncharacterized protein n=1 Tax=Monilinia laxa TaxID=61186 RepID=A0A5N6K8T2_MONLA|nr:hypothetical protein EYC80_001298 [Monilinia laxa]